MLRRSLALAATALLILPLAFHSARGADAIVTSCLTGDGRSAIQACTAIVSRLARAGGVQLATAHLARGEAYMRLGEMDSAHADMDEAVRLAPKFPGGYADRGFLMLTTGDFDQALTELNEAIRLDPKLAIAYSNRGAVHIGRSEFDLALEDLNEAIRLNPKTAVAYGNRGGVFLAKHEMDRALADLEEAIRLNPKLSVAYVTRGLAHLTNGENDIALADLDQAVRLSPSSAQAYTGRGSYYGNMHFYDRAFSDIDAALRLDPKSAGAHAELGSVLRQTRKFDRALAELDEAIRLNSRYSAAYATRGGVRLDEKDFDRALADANHALQLDPQNSDALSVRANVYRARGDLDRALADSNEALRFNPKDAGVHVVHANVLCAMKDFGRAQADYAEAFQLDPKEESIFLGRGECWEARGDYVAAKADYESYVALVANDPEGAKALGRVREALAAQQAPHAAVASAVQTGDMVPQKRVALVIGDGAYQTAAHLQNPARDAAAIGDMLRTAGFASVDVETDLGVAAMRRAIRAFADAAADADVAVVYFAGHGLEMGGRNYLVPVDAALRSDIDVEDETIDLDRVLEVITPARRLKLVILDACRDNPFASGMRRSLASRSLGRGLAPPDRQPSNVLIAYAARDGSTAADGEGEHSPFTTALLKHLTAPGLDIRIALGMAHDDVMAATHDAQEPYIYGALGGGNLPLAADAAKP